METAWARRPGTNVVCLDCCWMAGWKQERVGARIFDPKFREIDVQAEVCTERVVWPLSWPALRACSAS